MGVLLITFQDKENAEERFDTAATHPEVISHVHDSLRLLERLGTAEAAKLLDTIKTSRLNPPSFIFQSHDGCESRANAFFNEGLQLPFTTDPNNWTTGARALDNLGTYIPPLDTSMFDHLLDEPVRTINPALLSIMEEDENAMIPISTPRLDNGSSVNSNTALPMLEADASSLFVSPNNTPTRSGTSGKENAPQKEDTPPPLSVDPSSENLQPDDCSDLVMGLPTPPSDAPSATPTPETNRFRAKSKQFKVTKKNSGQKGSLAKRSPTKGPSSAKNALSGLSDPDLQQALEAGEGLIRGLREYQESCIWQKKDFWFEKALSLSISTDSSAEERCCQVFAYAKRLGTQTSDQKLRLRISHALLYLSFELVMQKKQSGIHSGTLKNPDQHRAATLTVNYLLRRLYPNTWDSMDAQMKTGLRRQFHDQKREGSRCWRVAGVLGLGALLACGNTLHKVIKDHSKYRIQKLDAVINYVINAHPGVVSLYHEFDALVKQILLGETLTSQPTQQTISDSICQAAATKATLQQAEENWQQIDPACLSQELIKEAIRGYE